MFFKLFIVLDHCLNLRLVKYHTFQALIFLLKLNYLGGHVSHRPLLSYDQNFF
jgi:hypothetical protein